MNQEKEFHPGIPPENPEEEIAGLEIAVDSIKKRIAEYQTDGADVSDLELHLKSLENRLWAAKGKRLDKAA